MAAQNVTGTLVPGGSFRDISFVPVCSTAVSVSEYSLTAAAAYDPTVFSYYKVPVDRRRYSILRGDVLPLPIGIIVNLPRDSRGDVSGAPN